MPPQTQDPFNLIKLRTLFFILLGTFPLTILVFFLSKQVLGFSDALIETVISSLWLYGISLLWMRYQFRRNGVSWKHLIGNLPSNFNWLSNFGLLICMLLFNFGSLIASVGLISFIFPNFAVGFLNDHPNTQSFAPAFFLIVETITAVIVAPIVEELLMRGVFLHRFQIKWGINWAIMVGATIFAIGHANIVGMFMVALIMSILYLKYKTLLIPIVFHAMNNIVVSLLQLAPHQDPAKPADLADVQAALWFGLVLVIISSPVLVRFLIKNWPKKDLVMPYMANLENVSSRI